MSDNGAIENASLKVAEAALIEKMNLIRNASEQHVEQLHHEVQRLSDWREHIRARPLLAIGVSALAGYFLITKVVGAARSAAAPVRQRAVVVPRRGADDETSHEFVKTTLAAGAMSMVGSLVSTAIRMAATHYVRSLLDKRGRD